jgi:hypothetical protein
MEPLDQLTSTSNSVIYGSRNQYLVGPPKTASGKRRQRRRPCPADILHPPHFFMTRDQVAKSEKVKAMPLKIKPALVQQPPAPPAPVEQSSSAAEQSAKPDRRSKARSRVSRDVASTRKIKFGDEVGGSGSMQRLPSVGDDGGYSDDEFDAMPSAEGGGWEHVTQAGVTFWLHEASGAAQFENPYTGAGGEGGDGGDDGGAMVVEEEPEITKVLDGCDDDEDFEVEEIEDSDDPANPETESAFSFMREWNSAPKYHRW